MQTEKTSPWLIAFRIIFTIALIACIAFIFKNSLEAGGQIVEAEVPMAEMQDFTTYLRQLTQGRGHFTFEFVRYETLPQMLEAKVIEQAKALGNLSEDDA